VNPEEARSDRPLSAIKIPSVPSHARAEALLDSRSKNHCRHAGVAKRYIWCLEIILLPV